MAGDTLPVDMQKTDLLAAWYLFIFLGFVPYLTIKSARQVRSGAVTPPRARIFRGVLVMEALFLVMALFAARTAGIEVFARGEVRRGAVLAVAALLVLALVLQQVLWRFSADDLKRRLLLSRPNHPNELGWWFLVSLAAGVVEDVVYRGVMPARSCP